MRQTKFFYNKIKNKKHFIRILYLLSLSIIICFSVIYESYKYNILIDTFKTKFTEYNFSEANNLLLTRQNFNPFKIIMINNDIYRYLDDRVNTISNDIQNNNISPEDALVQIKEIERYNIISSDKLHNIADSIELIQDSIDNYNNGIEFFNSGDYIQAISSFKKVSSLDLDYSKSLIYLNNSKNRYKEDLLSYCDNLVSNDYYSEALSKITDNQDLLGDDLDIKEKIIAIKMKQQEYLDENSEIAEASSYALTNNISINNINKLNIESATSYFINVNLENQKTYIYQGKADKWKLIRTCPCSTGVNGEDTPSGSFSTKEKGDWFFSTKYEQGGKYWTQVTGDILFHSLPFDKDKTNILDYTLNKPSSHGCIRLTIDDAKWIYTNIPKGSKVIIK